MSADHLHAVPEPGPDEEPGPGETARRGFAALPDLRPYCDPRLLAAYGPLAVKAARRGGPLLLRALRVLGRGVRILLDLLAGWLSGTIGRRGSVLGRLGITAAVTYTVVRTSMSHPAGPWVAAGVLLIVVTLAGLDRLPGAKPAAKAVKTPAKTKPRSTLATRFTARRKPVAEPPESTPETPVENPLTALLRELIGADNGVHLAVLRPAMRDRLPGLSGASDKALSDLLREAGFDPSRKFRAAGVPGCAGVHRSQLPPLSPGDASGPLSGPGERLRPADSPGAESAGERAESGLRYVRDPEHGPDAWRIEHDE